MQPSTRPRNDLPEGDALNAGGLGHYARGWKVSSGHAGPSGPQSTLAKAVVSLGPGTCGLRRRFDLSASSLPICVPRLLGGCFFFFIFLEHKVYGGGRVEFETARHGESSAGVAGLQSSALLPCGCRDPADPSISYHPGSGTSAAVRHSNPPQKPAAAPGAGAAGEEALRRPGFIAVLGTLSAKRADFPRPCPAPRGGQHPMASQREGLTVWPPPLRGDPSLRAPDSRAPPGVSRSLRGARAAAQLFRKPASSLLPRGAPACALGAQRPVVPKSAAPGCSRRAPLPEGFSRQPHWGGISPQLPTRE